MPKKGKNNTSVKNKKASNKNKYTVKNAVVNYYLVLMLAVFPLFCTSLANIRHDKLYAFYAFSALLVLSALMILIVYFSEHKGIGGNEEARWYLELSAADYAFGAFALCCLISTVLSEYPSYALWGYWYQGTGRNNGLLLMLTYFLVYIVISRAYRFREYVFLAAAASAIIVSVLAVLHFFYIDPFGMYENCTQRSIEDFMSTIGNKNLVSAFCCIMLPLFSALYLNAKDYVFKSVYAVAAVCLFAAMLCSDSDGAVLGFVPVSAVILAFYIKDLRKLCDLSALFALMLLGAKIVWAFSYIAEDRKGLGVIQSMFIFGIKSWVVLFVFVVITAALAFALIKKPSLTVPKFVFPTLIGLYIAVFCALIAVFINYTFIDKQTELSGFMKLFRFDDNWGTHRGYMWIRSWEIFKNADIKDKLFGCGPDTFYSAFKPYSTEMLLRFSESTNCAHNEFLNYLVTIGVFGLASYLTLFISAIAAAARAARKNCLAFAFICPVIGYLFQSSVNIATPIVTPLLFVFLALAMNIAREAKRGQS